jgi:hypothetical protein
VAFIKTAQAELSVDRIPLTFQSVDESDPVALIPTLGLTESHYQASLVLPAGTATFLFTDVADSRWLW